MGKVIQFPESARERNESWQRGYSDGYHNRDIRTDQEDPYYTGYDVGRADRVEDDDAVSSGTLDLLSEDERLEIYGDEKDLP